MKSLHLFAFFFSFLTLLYAEARAEKSGCVQKEKVIALLKTTDEFLLKAINTYPTSKENSTDQEECSSETSLAYIEMSKKIVSDIREIFPSCIGSKIVDPNVKYRDCSEILASGFHDSGVYTIWLGESNTTEKKVEVFCDMETDKGGWTVIQRRGTYPVQQDFDQDWGTYEDGFGNITEEFWLGNENIYALCNEKCRIRFDLEDKDGNKGYAAYKTFTIFINSYSYNMYGYTGDIGDAMDIHKGYFFSTKDKNYEGKTGGWWHRMGKDECNLNGIYQPGKSDEKCVFWHSWKGFDNLAKVEIKVKRK